KEEPNSDRERKREFLQEVTDQHTQAMPAPSYSTRAYTANVRRAQSSQENLAARSRPLSDISWRSLPSRKTRCAACSQASSASGGIKWAASPATSGSEAAFDASTGHPDAIASRTGRPNPSYREG